MALISENSQSKKLKNFGINIKTKYIVGNKLLERNTDNSHNDDINNGVRITKEYYLNDSLVHKETEFDTRIEYTFISQEQESKEQVCPNCGWKAKLKDFVDGCPYCGTYYNVDYTNKDLGSKHHYDMLLRSNIYRIITLVIDIIVSMIFSYFFIKYTSRTFNNYDIYKVLIYGAISSVILYYLFYIADAYVVLGPIKRYKNRENERQIKFWEKSKLDKKVFFNNFNYEIRNYYYSKDNIIDYDVIDYLKFRDYTKNGLLHVEVTAFVRIVYFNNGKITSNYVKDKYVLVKHDKGIIELKKVANIIKCHNCGSSIDASLSHCEYCGTEIKYLQEWMLESKD